MKENKILLAVGGGCAAILAVLGLVVFWQSPDYYNLGELYFFKRQLVAHGVGIAVALGAATLGWRRMVRGAPWIGGAFLAAVCLSVFTVWIGRCGNSNVGSCWVNVWSCAFAVASLALAGVTNGRFRWSMVAGAVLSAVFGCLVLCGGDADGMGFAQQQLVAAWDSARWFGGCGASLREVPMAFASGITSGAGVVSGRMVSVLGALAAFGLAAAFFILGLKGRDWGIRLFGLSFGTFLAGQTAVAFLQCVGWMPMTRCVIPLFAFGVMQSIITWFAIGLGVAAILDDREGCNMGCADLIDRFNDKVNGFRRVRLPEAWYAALREPKEVVLVPNAEGGADLISVETFTAECEVLRRKAVTDPAVHRALEMLERKTVRIEVGSRPSPLSGYERK